MEKSEMSDCEHEWELIKNIPANLSGGPNEICKKCKMLNTGQDEIRQMLKDIVSVITSASSPSPTKGLTALALAAHFLCESTGYSHDYYCNQVKGLKERADAEVGR
jgi:hypothetical protein